MTPEKKTRINALKDLIRNPFAWPGGYEKFAVMDDGALICHKCAKQNFPLMIRAILNQENWGWNLQGIILDCELESAETIHSYNNLGDDISMDYCAHCNRVLNP